MDRASVAQDCRHGGHEFRPPPHFIPAPGPLIREGSPFILASRTLVRF